ncbi:MAG: hypothetical protein EOO88_33695 [Pedobacter sp.]|nr:MAG: hypothetical protein EOO88_33695 [Pedobacter sp.]
MTYQEYNQRLSQLEERFQIEKDALVVECALANNPYQVGDVFTDYNGSIRIESIRPYRAHQLPTCAFYGLVLTNDESPDKTQTRREAYQINDVGHNPL